jgi:hypothetical protein
VHGRRESVLDMTLSLLGFKLKTDYARIRLLSLIYSPLTITIVQSLFFGSKVDVYHHYVTRFRNISDRISDRPTAHWTLSDALSISAASLDPGSFCHLLGVHHIINNSQALDFFSSSTPQVGEDKDNDCEYT